MHAFGLHIATKMECGNMLCTSGSRNDQENQDLKGDIYISMLLFIKTCLVIKKIALFKYEYYSLLLMVRKLESL